MPTSDADSSPATPTNRATRRRKLVEWSLIGAGLLCLGLFAHSVLQFRSFQNQVRPPSESTERSAGLPPKQTSHPVIGKLLIPRIGLSVLMVEGDDDASLALAAGHMPGTAMAGYHGNMVIAGHRDSAFWPLRKIQEGDRIQVITDKLRLYRVDELRVVDPEDLSALADSTDSRLTLVTCYPFRHVGPAPQRFIVRAKLVR